LYYYVIDLATSNNKQAIYKVLSKKERKHYIGEYASRINVVTDLSRATKSILKDVKDKGLRQALKDAKVLARGSGDIKIKKTQKRIIKICKI
jgi:hypothetical protein